VWRSGDRKIHTIEAVPSTLLASNAGVSGE
jgi:hypothetical protein